ncbi:MAG: 50S ribosomal protein L19e [Candidatus Caldarchaeum sp.]|uniref:Large ribosomal subunit protein eL19 n=1 Tax=Caldiarchaeum subterraneum TaxID=311458 RepID=A0A7J3VTT1_CALS0
MKLDFQKRVAADLLKCGVSRVKFDPERLEDIESAITRAEVRRLIQDGAIVKLPARGVSRARVEQRRRRGPGSREGAKHSLVPRKRLWISRVRAQRAYLKKLRDQGLIGKDNYRVLYSFVKAGNFKSVASLKEFIKARKMMGEASR